MIGKTMICLPVIHNELCNFRLFCVWFVPRTCITLRAKGHGPFILAGIEM